ncbi:hypothetical protein QMG61_08190 [Cryobacterium sp. PH31-AA6]|uniref:hypothetical protein n=1 Tax=Cryobacterium sp. PH31-AA6 TaxID=3046205 RepID=UPI0024B9C42F|nr:hypothetical protein [Cryobacterium sp. PH31-AA6]MDJ0323743.1 hypothetical protein [Cryobacterium sp. PH31-AA6]
MKFSDTLRKLWRRWYIVFPGVMVAAALAVGAWYTIPPGYERSATQLLIPGAASMPEGANPYLFLGGLAPAADVLVRAVGSENVLNEMVAEHPDTKIAITRDTTTAGPVMLIAVTAPSDAAAQEVLDLLVTRTATMLEDLQTTEKIASNNRVTVLPITVDTKSVLQQRTRMVGAAGAGVAGVVLTLLLAGLVDGFSSKRRRRRRARVAKAVEGPDAEPEESSVENGTVTDPEQDESLSSPAETTGPAKATQSRSGTGAAPSMEPEFATLGRQSRNDDNDDEERAPLARPVRQAR